MYPEAEMPEEQNYKETAQQPSRGNLVSAKKSSSPMDEAIQNLYRSADVAYDRANSLRKKLDKVLGDCPPTSESERAELAADSRETYVLGINNSKKIVDRTISILNEIMDRLLV